MEKDPEKATPSPWESDQTDVAPSITLPSSSSEKAAAASTTLPASSSPAAATTPPPPAASDEIPDGGLQAWLQVLGSAAILVCTWGVINTFGVFQAYYETTLLPSSTSSSISWIGSTQAALLFLVGVIAGPLYDAGYFRPLLFVGLFLIVLGQFMTSLCEQYWQIMLAQGVTMGMGMGMTFLPSAAILGQYFSRHRALALGLSSVGSPVAGAVFPIMFTRLEPKVGFGWATRAIAFILLGVSVLPIVCMKTRVPPTGKARAVVDMSALRDAPYVLFIVGGLFGFLTLYVPFFYITLYATSKGAASPEFAPYLVTLINAGSIAGRIVPNALADKYGSMNLILVCTFGSAVMVLGWLGITNMGGSIVYVLLYGAFSGGVVSLTPSVLVSLAPDMSRVGARMGMGFVVSGIAILVGTPIAGAILGSEEHPRWVGAILYAAFGLVLATGFYASSRFLLYRRNRSLKA
ncbi:major facilitator superfamily domain-containing protein [Staphylotrichum tortipilum]|uniref:Major facilitator superfamily domain-containing protein n=1 Tax=Staphylotrichum tortipilum TaxID=2831512 RepID=A0AAN6MCU0_9PEZI|nr:major facilitator superfamily domain-containing protein [Staphylotrichum longicolle]